jgi:hypothetical protein
MISGAISAIAGYDDISCQTGVAGPSGPILSGEQQWALVRL